MFYAIVYTVLRWIVGMRPIVRIWDLGVRGMPSVGVFLSDPSPYLP